ncbi:hypothetical protein NIES21_61160 (plasmid) [Anabaenopsis circularis NIES-21]|uniref:Uncharacterized protein n=1 Tax=Anabaenopsis circularis NIES-21 TaxID=1085406 RepID=A0A1Z4GSI5_9CYAN|nr:hypothetical protein NIES21_61160 [Anabaenopsis circularis NIES-21]
MYRQNKFLVGLCGIFATILAANTLIMDVFSTAHSLAWLVNWARTVNLDRVVTELLNTAQNWIEVFAFLIMFLTLLGFAYLR